MSILTMPAVAVPNNFDISLTANSRSYTSELNGVTQIAALPGDKWGGTLTYSNRTGAEARQLLAFFASLRGISGRFYLPAYDHRTPYGTANGTPLVRSADQTGVSLLTDGWSANQSGLLVPGDYFQVGYELKMITAVANSDSSGIATLQFTPPLRVSPGDNSAVITTNPCFVAKLQDNDQTQWSAGPWSPSSKIYAMTVAIEEALDV